VARGTTDANGRFLLKFVTARVVPPLVLQVIDAGGNVLSSTTDEQVPTGKAIRVNVNPLTDKITSDVLTAGAGSTDKRLIGSQVDLSKLAAAKSNLVASTNTALGAAGIANTSNFDPVRSIYNLDGTGVDAVIESISHSREPTTGATQLRTKLSGVQTNTDGSVTPSLITTATPLAASGLAINSNPALVFAKITAWMNEMNRCFALSSAARATDVNCADADGSRLISLSFKDNGKDLAEAYRTLYSESDRSAVQGSTLSNPNILFNVAASSAPPEYPITLVEFTVDQPRTGPLAGSRATHVHYTTTMSFVTTASGRAVAGNWILGGNQKRYDASIQPGYELGIQLSKVRCLPCNTITPSPLPAENSTLLEIRISPLSFDTTTRSYVSANIRAARVKGPGLPSAGLVLSPSTLPGASRYLTPHNREGDVTLTNGTGAPVANSTNRPIFYLGIEQNPTFTISSPTTLNATAYWLQNSPSFANTPLTDFSSMQASSRYTIEYFLTGNATNIPDSVETTRIIAPVMPPSYLNLLAFNMPDFFLSSIFPDQSQGIPGCSFTFQWRNNTLQALPVDSVLITDGTNIINADVDAVSDAPPVSATAGTSCSAPGAIDIGAYSQAPTTTFRQAGTGTSTGRYRLYITGLMNKAS
jgi:hypothetical protein